MFKPKDHMAMIGYVSYDMPLMYVIYWTDIVGYIPRCSQSLQVAIKWRVTL